MTIDKDQISKMIKDAYTQGNKEGFNLALDHSMNLLKMIKDDFNKKMENKND